MQEIARRIAKVSIESKLAVVEDEYVQSFKVELMDAVVQWCRGASFSDICKVCHICLDLIMHGSFIFISSQINSRAALSGFFEGLENSFVKWPQPPRLLVTLNCKRNSKNHPRCWSGRILSFSVLLCICRPRLACFGSYSYYKRFVFVNRYLASW